MAWNPIRDEPANFWVGVGIFAISVIQFIFASIWSLRKHRKKEKAWRILHQNNVQIQEEWTEKLKNLLKLNTSTDKNKEEGAELVLEARGNKEVVSDREETKNKSTLSPIYVRFIAN